MPRNRRKGRRSSGGGTGSGGDESFSGARQGKFTEQDISDDEIDAFHDQRDEILFDTKTKKGKKILNDEPFDALGTGSRSVLDVEEADSDDSDADEQYVGDVSETTKSKTPKIKTFKRKPDPSTALAADSSEDEDEEENGMEEDDDIITGGWGTNKRSYYNTNDLDDLESDSEMDEDEKRSMELREAKKIQSRARQGMTDDDFGLGGDHLANLESGQAAREQRKKDLDVNILSNGHARELNSKIMSPSDLIARIKKETPETMALIGEFADVVDDMNLVSNRMKILQETNPEHPSLSLIHLHHQTLLAYVTTLSFYFYTRSLSVDKATTSSSLSHSAIIERLAKLKQGLSSLEDLGLGIDEDELAEVVSDDEETDTENDENQAPTSFLFKPKGIMAEGDGSSEEGSVSLGSLEEDELMQLDAEESNASQKVLKPSPADVMKIESLTSENNSSGSKENKRTRSRKRGGKAKNENQNAPLAGLADSMDANDDIAPPTKRRKSSEGQSMHVYDEYSEPTSLSTVDESEKDAKRRSLKFHTGQIDALEGGRKKNSRQLDGDLDIPYRDKERSRLAVASANANKVAKTNSNNNRRQLDNDDFGEDDARDWRDVMNMDGGADSFGEAEGSSTRGAGGLNGDSEADYYDLITSSRKASKQARKEEYDEQKASQRFVPADALEAGEHRSINRQIEKNRGLTPRRPKSSRNARVKKREKYAEAQKKLSSRGPVYKGGQSSLQGGYGGEKSGISTHVVKSRQFA